MGRTTTAGWVALLVAAAGCGGGSDLTLPGGDPAAVTLIQGDEQNGRAGEALPQPLVVSVTDGTGRPIDGATVVFVLSDPGPGASIAPDTTTTDADGHASATVVLGTRPGTQTGAGAGPRRNGAAAAPGRVYAHRAARERQRHRAVSGPGPERPG